MGRRRNINYTSNTSDGDRRSCSTSITHGNSSSKLLCWSPAAALRSTYFCAAALTLLPFNPARALVVVQTPVRTVSNCRSAGAGGAGGGNWRGFRDARRARTASSSLSTPHAWGAETISNLSGYYEAPGGHVRWRSTADRGRSTETRGGRRGGRVSGGAARMSVWELQSEDEWEFEEEVQRLEGKLARAIENEKYDLAARTRDALFSIHMDETSAVLATNSAFYAAFTLKDAERMEALWLPSRDVMCIHPGDEPIMGHKAVTRSWRSLFLAGDHRFTSSVISPADVKIRMRGTTAIVQCREEVTTADDVSTPWMARIKSEIASRAKLVGGAEDSLGGVAGTGGEAGGGTKKKKKKPRFLNVTNIYRKAGGRWLMVHHHSSLPAPSAPADLRTVMGDLNTSMGMRMAKGPDGVPRIFNLYDQQHMDGGKLEEMMESLRSQLPGGGVFSLGAGSMDGRLHPHGMLVIGDDEEEDEDDDDEDDDMVHISKRMKGDRESQYGGAGAFRRRWPAEEELAKKTMKALRALGEQKRIGKREQRRLITDILKHAGANELSPVEVAYDMLVEPDDDDDESDGKDDTACLSEFVEQAKILASDLFEEDLKSKKNNNRI